MAALFAVPAEGKLPLEVFISGEGGPRKLDLLISIAVLIYLMKPHLG